MNIDNAQDTVVIIAELPQAWILHGLYPHFVYGDDTYEFTFQKYSPIAIARYPGRFFFYAQYSQAELKELSKRVDMTFRTEPVDYLMYCVAGYKHITFLLSDSEMLTKLGEFTFVSFEDIPRGECLKTPDGFAYVLEEIFGKVDQEINKKNNIVIFESQNSMLGFLNLLVYTLNFPKEHVRVGKVPDRISGSQYGWWALALEGVTDEVKRLRDTQLGTYEDIEVTEHTVEIPAENHGFYVEENSLAVKMMSHSQVIVE